MVPELRQGEEQYAKARLEGSPAVAIHEYNNYPSVQDISEKGHASLLLNYCFAFSLWPDSGYFGTIASYCPVGVPEAPVQPWSGSS